jgi:TMEM175 potassium channel family protein
VLAIIITIMVLELRVPHGDDLASLVPLIPKLLSYVLSFVYLAIYWNNHHHMLHVTHRVTGSILWANMHLLFWLSLIPFATGWMGENRFAPVPTVLYGVLLLMAGIAYWILTQAILKAEGADSVLAQAVGDDLKGKGSILLYVAALFLAFLHPAISRAVYVLVALIWLIPDRRIERALSEHEKRGRA